jgi:2-keto-4-pentenoate hydratase
MTPQTLLSHLDSGQMWPASAGAAPPQDVAAAYQRALAVRKLRQVRWRAPASRGSSRKWCAARAPGRRPGAACRSCSTASSGWRRASRSCSRTCRSGKFTAADTVADSGLHARLLVGRKLPVREAAADGAALERKLARCAVTLTREGEAIDQGSGANVLDGPLHALAPFVHELRACPGAPRLRAGDVVTTGTWTNAYAVAPGETWTARFDAPLPPLEVRFSAG